MKYLRSSGKPRNLKAFFVRRVVGVSMHPNLRPGKILYATSVIRKLYPGEVVVVRHHGREKVKRIERVQDNKVFVIGDNLVSSTDSRHFGWIDSGDIVGKVLWPRVSHR